MHIKLGLVKQFAKDFAQNGLYFEYLANKFTAVSKKKLKAAIFDVPQIRQLITDGHFPELMKKQRKICFIIFKFSIAIKFHYLHNHLQRFPATAGVLEEFLNIRK